MKRLLLFLLIAVPLRATTYYVDNCVVTGNDGNNGTSPATPWLTLGKIQTVSFNPGDSILFQGACEWRNQALLAPSNGTMGNPITFTSYGTGTPIFSGAKLLNSGWSLNAGNVWQVALTTQTFQVFFNSVRGTPVGSIGAIVSPNQWYWAANVLYVYSTSNPASAFTNPGVEASQITTVISYFGSGVNNLIFYNLQVQQSNHSGIYLVGIGGGSGVQVGPNVTTTYNYYEGLNLATMTRPLAVQVTATYNGFNGIDCSSDADCTIDHSITNYNCAIDSASNNFCGGVKAYSSTAPPTVQFTQANFNGLGTTIANFEGGGIWLDTVTAGAVIRYCFTQGNNLAGIHDDASNGMIIYGNVATANNVALQNWEGDYALNGDAGQLQNTIFYNNTGYGSLYQELYVYGQNVASGCINNIITNNLLIAPVAGPVLNTQNGCNNVSNGSGNVYTYNGFGPQSANFINWSGTNESTYTAWETATGNCGSGGCSHSMQSNPSFVNPAGLNFGLNAGSPAINAGTNVGSTYYLGLRAGSTWPNGVILMNQLLNSGWEMGAYVYSSPGPFITGSVVQ
jgi:hypothetical protein